MPSTLETIALAAAPHGLNLVAAIPIAGYDASVSEPYRASPIDPIARTIVVIGNGGGDFWRAFRRHAEENPGWRDRDNPLDEFTREIVERDLVSPVRRAGIRC